MISDDLVIIGSIVVCAAAGLWSVFWRGSAVTRAGSLLSALVAALGVAYSGLEPVLYERSVSALSLIGCAIVVVGLLFFVLFLALGQLVHRAERGAPRQDAP